MPVEDADTVICKDSGCTRDLCCDNDREAPGINYVQSYSKILALSQGLRNAAAI